MEIFYIVALVMAVASACLAYIVAHAKGYDGTAWATAGFFLSFLALIAIAGMPMRKDAVQEPVAATDGPGI